MTDAAHRFVADAAMRLDAFLAAQVPGRSRRRWVQAWSLADVRINGRRGKKGDLLAPGDVVTVVNLPPTDAERAVLPDAEAATRLPTLWVSDEYVVVNKPRGMASQPLLAGELGTAASGLAAMYPECATVGDDPRDGGLVHRLDRGTSGVLVAARTQAAWQAMRAAFGSGAVRKTYFAITEGAPFAKHIVASLVQRGNRSVVDAAGLAAETWLEVVTDAGAHALVSCQAHTGRMHQVRAHLAHVGTPLAGDTLYGGHGDDGFWLHAASFAALSVQVEAPWPADFAAALTRYNIRA